MARNRRISWAVYQESSPLKEIEEQEEPKSSIQKKKPEFSVKKQVLQLTTPKQPQIAPFAPIQPIVEEKKPMFHPDPTIAIGQLINQLEQNPIVGEEFNTQSIDGLIEKLNQMIKAKEQEVQSMEDHLDSLVKEIDKVPSEPQKEELSNPQIRQYVCESFGFFIEDLYQQDNYYNILARYTGSNIQVLLMCPSHKSIVGYDGHLHQKIIAVSKRLIVTNLIIYDSKNSEIVNEILKGQVLAQVLNSLPYHLERVNKTIQIINQCRDFYHGNIYQDKLHLDLTIQKQCGPMGVTFEINLEKHKILSAQINNDEKIRLDAPISKLPKLCLDYQF